MKPIAISILLLIAAVPAISQEVRDDAAFADVQKRFAESYNRKDVDAMATAFSENAVRVTPSGIFRGRQAIRQNFQDALNMGLRDYSVKRTDTRSFGGLVFNVGEWQAKLGEQPFHGYYTAILGLEGDQVKILEETVTVAAP